MALHCEPSLLETRNGEIRPRDWNNLRKFVVKSLLLLHYMGINQNMTGAKLVPEGVQYNKGSNRISIRINRDPNNLLHKFDNGMSMLIDFDTPF